MKGYGQHYRSPWLLVILLILGGIVGSMLGHALGGIQHLVFLGQGIGAGLPVTTLNLNFLTLAFGFTVKINPVSILGFIVAFVVYLRL